MWNSNGQGGYGGGGGFGGQQTSFGDQGGGYLNSPGFGASQQSSQQNQRSQQRAQSILACTVAQLLSATQQEDNFYVDGIELRQVTLVGLVRSVKETATRHDYEIDDMTGPLLDVRMFIDNDDDTPEELRTIPMRENTYVRVYGHARAFGGKRNVVAFRMLPITDMNELSTHLLEVIQNHLALTRGQKAVQQSGGIAQVTGQGDSGGYAGGYGGGQPDQGLNAIQQQVQNVIRSCADEQGISITHITDRLKGTKTSAIRDAVEFLSSEGHIYSTIDDEHYRSTDAM